MANIDEKSSVTFTTHEQHCEPWEWHTQNNKTVRNMLYQLRVTSRVYILRRMTALSTMYSSTLQMKLEGLERWLRGWGKEG